MTIIIIEQSVAPVPNVYLTAPNTQIVGQSLTPECSVTTVRGITSRVDIVWKTGNSILEAIEGTNVSSNESHVTYLFSYIIPLLSTTDDGRVYQCEVVINTSPPVMATGSHCTTTNRHIGWDTKKDKVTTPYNTSVTVLNSQLVGQSLKLECSATIVRGITSRVDIVWINNGSNLDMIKHVNISLLRGNTAIYSAFYTLPLLRTTDNGRVFQCEVVINTNPPVMATGSVTLDVTVPNPTVSITPSGPIQGAMGDEGTYECSVMILDNATSSTTEVEDMLVSTPNMNLTAPSNQIVGQSLTLECSVTTVRGITSRLDIVWSSGGVELQRISEMNVSFTNNNSATYISTYTIPQLNTTDDGRVYQCEVVINTSPPVMATVMISWMGPGGDNITNDSRVTISPTSGSGNGNNYTSSLQFMYLMEGDEGTYECNVMILETNQSHSTKLSNLTVPSKPYNISVVNFTDQIVGQSLTLECSVTTVRGITSRVDIVWSSGSLEIQRINESDAIVSNENSTVYRTVYTIPLLSTTDDGRVYQCEVVINTSPPILASSNITINTTVPIPGVSVIPFESIQGAMVGSPQEILCTVSTVSGVELSSIMINWIGPGGGTITNDSRVTISPTISVNNDYISTLEFTYLTEGDEGAYTCAVMLLETTAAKIIEIRNLTIPATYGLSLIAHHVQIVGQSLTLECSVTTVRGITSRVTFIWSNDRTILKEEETDIQSFDIQNLKLYSNSYTISQLSTTDDGKTYQCEVVIDASPPIMDSGNVTLDVTVPTPTVHITPSGPIQGAMVGSPQDIQCTVSTVSGVELSSVMISWMVHGGDTIRNDSRVAISPTSGSGNNYTSTLKFAHLMEGDEGIYVCNVMILEIIAKAFVEIHRISVRIANVSVTAPNTQIVGQSLTLECSVTTVRAITSRVDVTWITDGSELQRINGINASFTSNNSAMYVSTYTIPLLSTTDDSRVYQCEVVINTSPPVMATVPLKPYNISVVNSTSQIVGQSLTLECSVTTVRGITSRVDIVWNRSDQMLITVSGVNISFSSNNITIYSSSYTIPQLSTTDDGRVYQCEAVINTSPSISVSSNITLLNIVPIPDVSVIPFGSIEDGMIGSPQEIHCIVSTVSGVEESSVMISWLGPGGDTIKNGSRMIISPITSVDNDYFNTLEFTYLMEGDEGIYTCDVNILDTTASKITEIGNLTVPTTYGLTLIAHHVQIVGQSLTLECSVTTVRGITSRMSFIWSSNGTVLKVEEVNIQDYTLQNLNIYSSTYTIALLGTEDDRKSYQCKVLIDAHPQIIEFGNVTLDVTVPTPTVSITPSGPIQGAMVG
ncbi:hemicentin-1-like [Dysidea avara]|uniref:hemicentin-1-like n=1 Tax=Dysidea avara TaxID=196820 RepID=UPI003332F828